MTRTSALTSHGWSVTTRSCTSRDPPVSGRPRSPAAAISGVARGIVAEVYRPADAAGEANEPPSGPRARCRLGEGLGQLATGLLDRDDGAVHPAAPDLRHDQHQTTGIRR